MISSLQKAIKDQSNMNQKIGTVHKVDIADIYIDLGHEQNLEPEFWSGQEGSIERNADRHSEEYVTFLVNGCHILLNVI